MKRLHGFATAVFVALSFSGSAPAATLPAGFTETSVTGLSSPTAMAVAPDGRIFVCQQGGKLRVVKNGALLATPFVTLTVDSVGERGLARRGVRSQLRDEPDYVYVYYTVPGSPGAQPREPLHGQRRRRGGRQRDRSSSSWTTCQRATNHNGGAHALRARRQALHRGRRERERRQRADADQPARQDAAHQPGRHDPGRQPVLQHTPPASNRAIWALGLRNPFTFAVPAGHRAAMFINDVGQNTWEEINDGIAGRELRLAAVRGAVPARTRRFTQPALHDYVYGTRHVRRRARSRAATSTTRRSPQFPASYVGQVLLRRLLRRLDPRIDPDTDTAGRRSRPGISSPGGPARRLRRQSLLPRARRRRGVRGHVHRQQRAGDHAGPAEPDRSRRASR